MSTGALSLGQPRRPRRPSLTPLIDVVFLLLVFFMLAARFGAETGVALTAGGGGHATWDGPPRLIDLTSDALLLNGAPIMAPELPQELGPLMPAPDSAVVLRAGEGASVDRLAEVLGTLASAGFINVVVVE